MKRSQLLTAFYFLFILALLYRLVEGISNGYDKESWHITELLINYQGGFVRRGLLGEALYYISLHINFSPYYLIITLCLAAYLLLLYFFVNAFIKKGYPIFILPFAFFLGNPIINDFWVRKDIIQLLLFTLILHLSTKTGKRHIILINIVFIVGILIHESIAFFGLPFMFLLLYSKNHIMTTEKTHSVVRNSFVAITQLVPALFAFGLVLLHKGTASIANSIWSSWNKINFPHSNDSVEPPAAIDGISWSLKKGLSFFYVTLKNFEFDIYAPFAWILIILSIYFVLTNINRLNFKIHRYTPNSSINRPHLSSVLLIQLIAVIPLFILGWDYGRWVFLWTASSFAILLIIPTGILSNLLPNPLMATVSYINRQLDDYLSNSKAFLVLLCLVIGVPFYNWSILNYVDTLAPILVLQFISDVFLNGVVFIKAIIGLD